MKLGLVGSSQVRYYPVDTLKNENLEPIILSTDPKNAKEIIETGKLDERISTTIDQHQDMDAVFIFVGGNDVRVTSEVRDWRKHINQSRKFLQQRHTAYRNAIDQSQISIRNIS